MSNLQPHRTLINQWKSDYEQLKHVLEQEQLALESQTFDTLSIVTQQKNQMVNQINSHQVPPIMTHSGESLTNLNSFRRFCLDNTELKDDWLDMMSLVEKCCFKTVQARYALPRLVRNCLLVLGKVKGDH